MTRRVGDRNITSVTESSATGQATIAAAKAGMIAHKTLALSRGRNVTANRLPGLTDHMRLSSSTIRGFCQDFEDSAQSFGEEPISLISGVSLSGSRLFTGQGFA